MELLYNKQSEAMENCWAVAGFTVGELTSASFTGAISLSEGINLVKIWLEIMQAASDLCNCGRMTVFMGADSELGFGCQVATEGAEDTMIWRTLCAKRLLEVMN